MLANRPIEPVERIAEFSLGLNAPNEDAVLALSLGPDRSVIAVADGVGGSPRGDLASNVAVRVVRDELSNQFQIRLDVLFSKVVDELERVLNGIASATTLTLVRSDGHKFDVGHVGDTRAYHLRGFGIQDLTVDQNEGQLLIRQGVFTKRDIRKYPRRNVLTSALSRDRSYELFQRSGIAQRGDRILIVSDGVYEVLQRQELAELNSATTSPLQFMNVLREELTRRGLRDDSSAACVEFSS